MSKIIFEDFEVEYIYNKKLKNSYIKIDKKFNIVVKTPNSSEQFVHKLLHDKKLWIEKQYIKFTQNRPKEIKLEDEVLLFGNIYSINQEEFLFLRQKLNRLKNMNKMSILKCYYAFYLYKATKYLPQRVEYFANVMKLQFKELKFRKLKSRWGSCNSLGVVTLNSELMKIKKELIDYVIVHELAHLVYMNHSREFHNLVNFYLPNSQLLRKELKDIRLG